jgi:predicted secreted protein
VFVHTDEKKKLRLKKRLKTALAQREGSLGVGSENAWREKARKATASGEASVNKNSCINNASSIPLRVRVRVRDFLNGKTHKSLT